MNNWLVLKVGSYFNMSKKLTDPFAVVGGLGVNDNPIICGGYSKQECFLFEVL